MEGTTPCLVKERDGGNNKARAFFKENLVPGLHAGGKYWKKEPIA